MISIDLDPKGTLILPEFLDQHKSWEIFAILSLCNFIETHLKTQSSSNIIDWWNFIATCGRNLGLFGIS